MQDKPKKKKDTVMVKSTKLIKPDTMKVKVEVKGKKPKKSK